MSKRSEATNCSRKMGTSPGAKEKRIKQKICKVALEIDDGGGKAGSSQGHLTHESEIPLKGEKCGPDHMEISTQ